MRYKQANGFKSTADEVTETQIILVKAGQGGHWRPTQRQPQKLTEELTVRDGRRVSHYHEVLPSRLPRN